MMKIAAAVLSGLIRCGIRSKVRHPIQCGSFSSGRSIVASALFTILLLSGCHPNTCKLEPSIWYCPQPRYIASLCEPFAPLTAQERSQDWGKELQIGLVFAKELDLYRAVTAFKRSLVLLPCTERVRLRQLQYSIILAYYLGNKYQEAIEVFECSDLTDAGPDFPAFKTLLTILQDAYTQEGRCDHAAILMEHMKVHYPDQAIDQAVGHAVQCGDLSTARILAQDTCRAECIESLASRYCDCAKSPCKAQWLNAILPGAGYYYVGQNKSAMTSFVINALFTWAAYEFYHRGYYAAGAITTSLEMGWYFGGINGAGLAAKEYNEHTYNFLGKETLLQCNLFPVLTIQVGF